MKKLVSKDYMLAKRRCFIYFLIISFLRFKDFAKQAFSACCADLVNSFYLDCRRTRRELAFYRHKDALLLNNSDNRISQIKSQETNANTNQLLRVKKDLFAEHDFIERRVEVLHASIQNGR